MTDAPLDLRATERELFYVSGSAANDAVTRSTAGAKLLAALRETRAVLEKYKRNDLDSLRVLASCVDDERPRGRNIDGARRRTGSQIRQHAA